MVNIKGFQHTDKAIRLYGIIGQRSNIVYSIWNYTLHITSHFYETNGITSFLKTVEKSTLPLSNQIHKTMEEWCAFKRICEQIWWQHTFDCIRSKGLQIYTLFNLVSNRSIPHRIISFCNHSDMLHKTDCKVSTIQQKTKKEYNVKI